MKIVKNICFGGFGLSNKAFELYLSKKGIPFKKGDRTILGYHSYVNSDNNEHLSYYNIERNDPMLVEVVEELGEEANGSCADLDIVDIPDDVQWEISEYDGSEEVREVSRSW